MQPSKNIRVPKDMDTPRAAAKCRQELHHSTVYLCLLLTELIIQKENKYTDAVRNRRTRALVQELLGSTEERGILQRVFNAETANILTRIKKDLPDLTEKHLLLISYTAAGFTNKIIAALLDMKDEHAVSVMRYRLRSRIKTLDSPFREEYLEFIPRRACRIGQEMLYLHNL